MILSILLWSLLSLLIISITHRMYDYLKNILTIPKIKDLVNKPKKRYNDILTTINTKYDSISDNSVSDNSMNNALVSDIMKNELSGFLDEIKIKNIAHL